MHWAPWRCVSTFSRRGSRLAGLPLPPVRCKAAVMAQEARAWTITAGMTAPQAAGVIHTDFEKAFIRAETYG